MAALIEAAGGKGIRVTPKQIARWRSEDVLPPPISRGRGRGRGVARSYDDATLQQLVAVTSILKRYRSIDYAAFRLWVRGYAIPLDRVRRALGKLVLKAYARARELPTDSLESEVFRTEEKMVNRRVAPRQTRKMAREGRLAPMFTVMLQLVRGGGPVPEEQRKRFVRDFNEVASLDKARAGEPSHGIPGWLSGDAADEILESMAIAPQIPETVRSLTDEEMFNNRELFRRFERIAILFQFIQKATGDEAALGTALLTRSMIGLDIDEMGPGMFAALATLQRAKPEFAGKVGEMSASVDATLQTFREHGIELPQF